MVKKDGGFIFNAFVGPVVHRLDVGGCCSLYFDII